MNGQREAMMNDHVANNQSYLMEDCIGEQQVGDFDRVADHSH